MGPPGPIRHEALQSECITRWPVTLMVPKTGAAACPAKLVEKRLFAFAHGADDMRTHFTYTILCLAGLLVVAVVAAHILPRLVDIDRMTVLETGE